MSGQDTGSSSLKLIVCSSRTRHLSEGISFEVAVVRRTSYRDSRRCEIAVAAQLVHGSSWSQFASELRFPFVA